MTLRFKETGEGNARKIWKKIMRLKRQFMRYGIDAPNFEKWDGYQELKKAGRRRGRKLEGYSD